LTNLSKKVNLKEPIDTKNLRMDKEDDSFPLAYAVYFPLDSTPDSMWETCLEQGFSVAKINFGKRVSVIGNNLVVITALEDVGEKMIEHLKKIIDDVNQCVEEQNKTIIEKEKMIQARKKKEEEAKQKARDALKS